MCVPAPVPRKDTTSMNAAFSMMVAPNAGGSIKSAPKPKRAPVIAQHHYNDHANDVPSKSGDSESLAEARASINAPFPLRLYDMLESACDGGFSDVVSWQPHGRSFIVHKPDKFKELLPRYFTLTKIASFQRQLNLYQFQRLSRGPDRGCYYHEVSLLECVKLSQSHCEEIYSLHTRLRWFVLISFTSASYFVQLFLRGKPFLTKNMTRVKIKGTKIRARSNPDQEPNVSSDTTQHPNLVIFI